MKYFCVIGNPVAHSISPRLHNLGYKFLNIDASYSRMLLENGDDLREKFFKGKYDGANVTIPYKKIAFGICDEVFGIAKEIKAVNTLIKKDGKLYGYNTDAQGFLKSIEEFSGIKNILVLGAGGTARAIALALKKNGQKISILNRSRDRLLFFKNTEIEVFTHNDSLPNNFDLIVNATSAGLDNEELPASKDLLLHVMKNARYGVDVIYNKQTPFLKLCKEKGISCKDGADMLLFQGVFAFEYFLGIKANEGVISNMKRAFYLN